MPRVTRPKKIKEKTCPAGQKLVNGVCVPIEREPRVTAPTREALEKMTPELRAREEADIKHREAIKSRREELKILEEGGRRARTKEELMTPEEIKAEQRIKQTEILEKEEEKREEILPEEEPIEPEREESIFGRAYQYVDTLGGFVPDWEKQGVELKQGMLPIIVGGGMTGGVKKGKAVLDAAKVATGARATKLWGGMLKVLRNKVFQKGLKYGTAGYVLFTERKVGNIDSALSQVRESITLPVSLAAASSAPDRYAKSFDMITDLDDDVSEYASMIKGIEVIAPHLKYTGRLFPVYQRIGKLRTAIELAREQIAKLEAADVILSDEETALLLSDIDKILNEMENPIKFLGIF